METPKLTVKPSQLKDLLTFSIPKRKSVLITGKPGIGKTQIVAQACASTGSDLIVSHPAVKDPTDYSGLPFPNKDGKTAKFLPFGDLQLILEADKPTVFFLDDLGQSAPSVQAGCMQLILARQVNGHKVSDHVTFVAATNRRQDKAGVQGILEPVKSRFATIVELAVDTQDWVTWALEHNMPTELISYVRWRPAIFDEWEPTKEMANTPSPRTVARLGEWINDKLPQPLEYFTFAGAVGEACATEFLGFLKCFRGLPSVDKIIMNPDKEPVPTDAQTRYALSGALGARMNENNIGSILKYLKRMPGEIEVATIIDASRRPNETISNTHPFIEWANKNHGVLI